MPIPSPRSDEDQDAFIGRCMSELADEYPDNDQRAAICYDAWRGDDAAGLGLSGGARIAPTNPKGLEMAEHLHELRRRRAALVAKMKDLVDKEGDGDKPTEDISEAFAALQVSLAEMDGRIARVEAALAAAAQSAANGDDDDDDDDDDKSGSSNRGGFRMRGDGARVPATVKRTPLYVARDPRGLQMARYLLGLAHRTWQRCSWQDSATWVETRFGDSEVAKALNSSVTSQGGALIPQDFLADLVELLRANTVVRGSGPMTVGMPMGNLTIPRLAGGSQAS